MKPGALNRLVAVGGMYLFHLMVTVAGIFSRVFSHEQTICERQKSGMYFFAHFFMMDIKRESSFSCVMFLSFFILPFMLAWGGCVYVCHERRSPVKAWRGHVSGQG